MITACKIAKKRHAANPLGGRGGFLVGGRWHHKGVRVVYCAGSLSLAALEQFVHFGKRQRKISLVQIEIDIPEDIIELLPNNKLPSDWREFPAPTSTADLGTSWLTSGKAAVLCVPSVLSPKEHNYIVNPLHADAARIKVRSKSAYSFDPRMWK